MRPLAPDFVLGENRVQELLEKYDPRYRWHFIGRLQTNKVKYVVDKVELIHSLDREELAKEIENARLQARQNRGLPCGDKHGSGSVKERSRTRTCA